MSHIFDALQRSHAEHGGADGSLQCTATELLERAERQATATWKSESLPEQTPGTEIATSESTSFGGIRGTGTFIEGTAASERAGLEAVREVFSQFREIEISVSAQSRLVCLTDKETPPAEAFRLLGVRLRHLRGDQIVKKLLVTSTVPQEGKSLSAANLACTLGSRGEHKVLLLEGDLRRPSLSQMFGLNGVSGISEWLQGKENLVSTICHLKGPDIWLLPAGNPLKNPLEFLQSEKPLALIDQLAAWFDWVIIDSPPVLPLADTSVWAHLADGILLVARQGTTEKRQLQRGLDALDRNKLIGAIMNCSKVSSSSDYYYYAKRPETSAPSARSAL